VSDTDRTLEALRRAGPAGVTTLELRRAGISGNPSQRRAELEERGHVIDSEEERNGRRRWSRYVLTYDAEREAEGSRPDGGVNASAGLSLSAADDAGGGGARLPIAADSAASPGADPHSAEGAPAEAVAPHPDPRLSPPSPSAGDTPCPPVEGTLFDTVDLDIPPIRRTYGREEEAA
jgi:hypothetical protein